MKFMQWLHRWTGLIILLQIILWTISGLYFALVDHHGMKGHQYHQHPPTLSLNVEQVAALDPSWWSDFSDITKLRTRLIANIPQVEIHHGEGISFIDGRTGEPWRTHQNLAIQIANTTYSGPGEAVRVAAITRTRELNGWQGQGYRIDYNDDLNTRVYVDSHSGQVLDHRNTPWVVADWMFRLHFIDYTGGRNFNNLVIITAGIVTLWFALSGLILLVKLIGSGEMRVSLRNTTLRAKVGNQDVNLQDKAHKTILQTLQKHDIPVESGCGGGGTCGLCTVKLATTTKVTSAERDLLSEEQLEQGFRLACQHQISDAPVVEVKEMDVHKYTLELMSSEFLTPMLKELRFRVHDGDIPFSAGQYMQFLIPSAQTPTRPSDVPEAFSPEWINIKEAVFTHQEVRRSYSMATSSDTQELVFTVRYQPPGNGHDHPGVGSTYLCNMKVGQRIVAEGPYGEFQRLPGADRQLFFIGGGAGMAPLRALIQEELSEPEPRSMVFYYGARNRQELVYAQEFNELNQRGVVNYVPVLSEKQPSCEWTGEEGFVHEAVFAYLAQSDIQAFDFYVCGPPKMLTATLKMLEQLGVDQSRIRFDDFGI
ncbi:2Fe-2S iron-sulfur cluster binding domain-containing protein [Aliidiomarina halalkaliphila]|uniref:2Fe-2S iron-sulfur cluster binding domain-containing protein n=1 Tax=Aliidiomarina halalkaliphila TaxID=2593535 RepID=A0A552X1F5_9GAMM|nr:2Fe-2S iron-sulfur cluster-binding protein [Aliidiomarina halalkaliphila]TRW48880.1 2Fe-2S iron-sulfur cluster binding domain-containing protein [Aliidiomarina halalkaliphila]